MVSKEKKPSLEQTFTNERLEWTNRIAEMSKKMKKIMEVSDLMTTIYTDRQRSIEYHSYLLTLITKINKIYRAQYSQKYDYYSNKTQQRFPNERSKELTILNEMAEIVSKRELLDNHAKFMEKTTGTLDNLIYGIKYRIEIEQISRGKF